jgi:hypothetical protein
LSSAVDTVDHNDTFVERGDKRRLTSLAGLSGHLDLAEATDPSAHRSGRIATGRELTVDRMKSCVKR